jgi:hypothetical protein
MQSTCPKSVSTNSSTQDAEHGRKQANIPRLIKDVIAMPPHTLAIKQRREAQTLGDLALGDNLVAALGLPDDESADL